jgi:hypothetical protein
VLSHLSENVLHRTELFLYLLVWLPESNRGYQLLKDMGWKEDAGLGPTGQGRVAPIATVLKNDRAGLGVPHAPARVTHFTPMDFAEKARRAAARRARKRKDSPDSDSDGDVKMDPHNMTATQRKHLKTSAQQRDKDIAAELYTPDNLEGYEAYLR